LKKASIFYYVGHGLKGVEPGRTALQLWDGTTHSYLTGGAIGKDTVFREAVGIAISI
jgi:hypothetical protein